MKEGRLEAEEGRGKSRNVVITAAVAGPLEEAEGLRFNRKQQRD